MKYLILNLLLLTSCASKEKPAEVKCPTAQEEAVSTCRAQQNCKNTTSSGASLGVGFGTPGFGVGVGRSFPNESYTACIDRDLASQKEQSKNK